MKNMKKLHCIYLLLFVGIMAVGIVAAVSFRSSLQSFTPTDEAVARLPVGLEPDFGEQNQGFTDITGADLAAQAELVVVVTPTGVRRATSYATQSEMKVEQVLKENGNVAAGDTIFVYEAPRADPEGPVNHQLILNGFHPLMKPGRSYLLLLNFYQRPDGWNYSEENLKTYLLIDAYYGQFPMEEPKFMIMHETDYYAKYRKESSSQLSGTFYDFPPYSEIADYDCAYQIVDSDTPESNIFHQTYMRLWEEIHCLY